MSILVRVNGVKAPQAIMHRDAAERFNKLRGEVTAGAGFDFLAICGDMFRSANFTSSKPGVANRSWHKTGRAFDYDQNSKALVLVSEIIGGKQFFRTYLKCSKQDGSLGIKRSVRDMRGYSVTAYLFDFTATAESAGFQRIAAFPGWQKSYNLREFWHYQYTPAGLTWDDAMRQIKGAVPGAAATTSTAPATVTPTPPAQKIYGLNDRGDAVREIQTKLAAKGFLPAKEVDGIFGAKTKAAVQSFQRSQKLSADGLVGPNTRAKLFN